MEFRKNGIENAYYMPLAAPVGYYDSLKEDAENKYISEISFVGSVYQDFCFLHRHPGCLLACGAGYKNRFPAG